ncbi:hypothetical protein WBG78_15650 [Chryseolinea sp. T2]|uniref:hypothetical protein n=1 Tax=Chryseolinea sp. T2 TaxID=3129255 RepID=UPI003077184E
MKLLKVAVLLLAVSSVSLAQSFEGKIIYQNSYKSKTPNVTDAQFNEMMGTRQEYYIKGAEYMTATNGTFFQWQIYSSKSNLLYSKMSNSTSIFSNDGAASTDEIVKAEVNKGVTTILGHKCDELVLTCKNSVQKYYFSSEPKMDASLYAKHKFGNWSEVLAKTNAMPLKIIMDNQQFSLESVATDVTTFKVSDKIFELPAGSKVEKSPY